MASISRGDIFYIEKFATTGSEQSPGRPAVVVSNDMCNEYSSIVEVVYLTTQPKNEMPTHVTIRSLNRVSVALCEQITTVAKDRIGSRTGKVTEDEMHRIEDAMLVSLGIEDSDNRLEVEMERVVETKQEPKVRIVEPMPVLANYAVVMTERDLYKGLYEEMLNRMLPAKKLRGTV